MTGSGGAAASFTWIQRTGDTRQIIPALVEALYFVGLAKDSDAARVPH